MGVTREPLGMNARNFLYIRRYNKPGAKRLADDKLDAKRLFLEHNIATTDILAMFYDRKDIRAFDWKLPSDGFVIKPARGYGGGGILVMKDWDGEKGTSVVGDKYTAKELESHILDILDGAYSLQYLPDKAYIEERVYAHPFFRKLVPVGIPDIRIIVFNKIPVMAMLRLPTKESGGKANLHLGALGIGIDMRTGITTYALYKNVHIDYIPNTKIKTRGVKIPQWNELLLLAAKTQAVSGLGYVGVDIVHDARHGPMVLEINARPGLSIQLANLSSLRTRLERVEHMHIQTPERGVEVATSLFTEGSLEKVKITPKVVSVIQDVIIKQKGTEKTIQAKLDTGAYRSSIDEALVEELGLVLTNKKVFVRSASGEKHRPTVSLTFELSGKQIHTIASVADRASLLFPMIIGRIDLKGFLVDPDIEGVDPDARELESITAEPTSSS